MGEPLRAARQGAREHRLTAIENDELGARGLEVEEGDDLRPAYPAHVLLRSKAEATYCL